MTATICGRRSSSLAKPTLTSRLDGGYVEPLVAPINFLPEKPATPTDSLSSSVDLLRPNLNSRFTHDDRAHFHPHGSAVCASGCAASRHPTKRLSKRRFRKLLARYATQPAQTRTAAMDELLYYGPQTRQLLNRYGFGPLDQPHIQSLRDELVFTHARIAIRVVDSEGIRRTWLEPTHIPLDRRHVFDMETHRLQPLVTSGTVKRVGIDRLWIRL